jgi:hypothetical protein
MPGAGTGEDPILAQLRAEQAARNAAKAEVDAAEEARRQFTDVPDLIVDINDPVRRGTA